MMQLTKIGCILAALCSVTTTTSSTTSSGNPGKLRGSNSRALKTSLYTCVDNVCQEGLHKFYFNYSFADGCVLQGYTKTTDLLLEYCDGSSIQLDISCTSEYSPAGFSNKVGFGPIEGEQSPITQYTIKTLQENCACAQYCYHTAPEAPPQVPSLPFDHVCEGVNCFDGHHCINGECVPNDSEKDTSTPSNQVSPVSQITSYLRLFLLFS